MEKGRCENCGEWRYLQKDHVVPVFVKVSRGEDPEVDNHQRLCYDCHFDKTQADYSCPEYRAVFQALVRCQWTEEERARQSEGARKMWESRSLEERLAVGEQIRQAKTGTKFSAETRAKMSASHRGVSKGPHSVETKKKIGDSNRRKST